MTGGSNTITFPKGPLPPSYYTDDRGGILIGVASAFMALEIVAFTLRTVSRRIHRVPFGWDDALVIPALLLNSLLCILCFLAVMKSSAGRHTLVVLQEDPDKIAFMGKNALLISPIVYALAVAFSKGVILNLFLRLFRFGMTRTIAYIVAGTVVVHTTVTVFFTIFQCHPIHELWTEIVRNDCIDTQAFFEYTNLPNIVTDVVMLIIPLPEVWRLNTTRRMKLGVTITLLTASVGIVVSIMRMVGFFQSRMFADPAWESVSLMSYTVAEPGTYFLAACFPTFRPLLRYVSTHFSSSVTKMFGSRQRLGSSSGPAENWEHEVDNEDDPKKHKQVVRNFESIQLSAISTVTGKSVADELV
ncbi:hypothetical protein K491DRAFT_609137 [Lophiostoma macrostomum CBS 122681]|uniref:Rhodopsin domain-containing protein n=1 Tax=Lophiostoma macrostomum CBS 122681 TaxID=1314788 RepID=A0A6A6SVM5_9PLEO|nr:hypothetical protein K491DRAFT_609137 [Lophiostoma macrostomum CBS 122681]